MSVIHSQRMPLIAMLLTATLLSFTTVVRGASDRPEGADLIELDRFQGTWLVLDGEKPGEIGGPTNGKLTFNNGTLGISVDGRKENQYFVTIDSTKSPKEIDIRNDQNGAKESFPAIYQFEGQRLIICGDSSGNQRPKAFSIAEKASFTIWRLERAGEVKSERKPE